MKVKKISMCFCLTAFLTIEAVFQAVPVFALPSSTATAATSRSAGIARVEKTEWRYRIVDDRLQKRLWSISEGKWLTDWEWV